MWGRGRVEAIFLAANGGDEPEPVAEAVAVAGLGLEGDRYFSGTGTFSDQGRATGATSR